MVYESYVSSKLRRRIQELQGLNSALIRGPCHHVRNQSDTSDRSAREIYAKPHGLGSSAGMLAIHGSEGKERTDLTTTLLLGKIV